MAIAKKNETEETFEDFKRIILDGALNCEDDPDDL
jgi:hypothetical protein